MKSNANSRATRRPPAKNGESLKLDLLPDLLGYRLRQAQLSVFRDFAETMASDGLPPGPFGLMPLIGATPGLNQSRLAEAIDDGSTANEG